MKIVYLLQVLFVWVNCQKRPARQLSGDIIPIISYTNENNDGFYMYSYETGNGISVREYGQPRKDGEEIQNAYGRYSYTAPDGRVFKVEWYADETGFHAEGDHIPKFPKKPPGIAGYPGAPVYPIK